MGAANHGPNKQTERTSPGRPETLTRPVRRCHRCPPTAYRRLGARHHASCEREASVVGELRLAVDVAQNATAEASE